MHTQIFVIAFFTCQVYLEDVYFDKVKSWQQNKLVKLNKWIFKTFVRVGLQTQVHKIVIQPTCAPQTYLFSLSKCTMTSEINFQHITNMKVGSPDTNKIKSDSS